MNNEYVKKLMSKNPKDFEFAAAHIINNSDVEAFCALSEQSDFLFDFMKKNIEKRLSNVITKYNYRKLLSFFKIYSPDYDDFIVSSLVRFADDNLTDEMLEYLKNGTNEEKAYSAKYFSQINDTLAIDLLKKYAFSDFDPLAINSALALSAMKDEFSYNQALEKLGSDDEFERLSAVRFLSTYKDNRAVGVLLETMKKSTMPENIALEISYLQSFVELLDTDSKNDAILAVNHIINGLGEIVPLNQIFDIQLFEVLDKLIRSEKGSKSANVLLNARLKFDQLTENDEYIFDEDKSVKGEVYEIKNLLNFQSNDFWNEQTKLFQNELDANSDFVFSALELVQELNLIDSLIDLKKLLNSSNQTIILKTIEVIKYLNMLDGIDKNAVLDKISDDNIRLIIQSFYN